MIGIKVNGIFLDLSPGTTIEVQRKSPFFAINDVTAEYSTPISVLYSQKNAVALGLLFQYYSRRTKVKIDAELYDNGRFLNKCVLVLETAGIDLNNISAGQMTGYLLFGVSEFFSIIKDKKLSDLNLGGIRNFNWTTNLPDDGTNGFWQHIHDTWVNDSIPYVFYPVRNEKYFGDNGTVDWMNQLGNDAKLSYDFFSPIVPMIRLKYLIEQIFAEHGYTLVFEMDDTEWEKLTLVNLTKVSWVKPKLVVNTDGTTELTAAPADHIQINLKDHVPQNKTISDFLVQLFNRYGWAFLFVSGTKKVRMYPAKKLGTGGTRDWTKFASPKFTSNFNEDTKVFAFSNDIDSNDSLPSAPSFDNKPFLPSALTVTDLTAPSGSFEGRLRFCYLENKWYHVALNSTTNQYEYVIFADNIYDYQPKDYTDTISTTISTLPVYRTIYRSESGTDWYGFFPIMEQEATKDIGYRTLIYHGLTAEINEAFDPGPKLYPYASCLAVNPSNTTTLAWSNVYYHNVFEGLPAQVIEGIIPYWWGDFLNVLQSGEEPDFIVYLPLNELDSFSWEEKVMVKNISFFVKSIVLPISYTGQVKAVLKRVAKASEVLNTGVISTDGNSGKVYMQLIRENVSSNDDGNFHYTYYDYRVNLYSDFSATIPYAPSTIFYAYVKLHRHISNFTIESEQEDFAYFPVNSQSVVIMVNQLTNFRLDAISGFSLTIDLEVSLDPSGASNYLII